MVRRTTLFLPCLLLAACASDPNRAPAPVVERTKPVSTTAKTNVPSPASGAASTSAARPMRNPDEPQAKSYTVKKGDTLYSVALEHGLDYKEVAAWNQIADPNLIKVDQTLRLTPADDDNPSGVVVRPLAVDGVIASKTIEPGKTEPAKAESVKAESMAYPKALKLSYNTDAATVARLADGPDVAKAAKPEVKPAEAKPVETKIVEKKPPEVAPQVESKPTLNPATGEEEIAGWAWPAVGKVITPFSEASKGVDIAGKAGQPVLAAAAGKVVYAGTGLRGYGKLVIIKHNKTYLSAYAHNSQLTVKEGDAIKKGDKIAEMGNTDAEQVKLHFEIRRFGKPVDPNKYLMADK